jgi:hypothetical protein
MPEQEALNYLEAELQKQIQGFDDSRKFFRKQQFRFSLLVWQQRFYQHRQLS